MKKFLIALLAAALLVSSICPVALADNGGLYLSAKGGLGFMGGDKDMNHNQTELENDETKWEGSMLSYGASLGYNWLDTGVPIRTEVEYYDHGSVKMKHTDDNATFKGPTHEVQTMQFNMFYDFHNDTKFIPYVGAGVGMANVKSGGKTNSNFAYSLFLGSAYEITDMILLDFTYRINQFGDGHAFSYSDAGSDYSGKVTNLYSVEGTLGLRIQF